MENSIKKLEKLIGYVFKDIVLLEQALTHRSFSYKNNERLEFLGDAVLNFLIASSLYRTFPEADEGELSRLRALLVRQESLAELAQEFSLGSYIRLGSGELKSGGFRRPSILADVLESLVGAIYLDDGIETAVTVVEKWFLQRIENIDDFLDSKDAKTKLQEYLQAKKQGLPEYDLLKTEGEDHEKIFIIECSAPGYAIRAEGKGSSRRKAEQAAAEAFLREIGNDQ